MPRAVRRELIKSALAVAVGAMLGYLLGATAAGIAIALAVLLVQHVRRLAILRDWAEHPKSVDLPDAGALWGDVYERILERHQRSKKRKKQLAAIVGQFQSSTEALPDGAVVLAERGEIAWFNASAQALLGLRSHDVGLRLVNLLRNPGFTAYMEHGGSADEVEVPSPVNRAVTLSAKLIPYGNSQRLLIVRDISERKRLEAARRDFVANASHELRTPLTVLRGYLEMMEPEARDQGSLAPWRAPLAEMRAQAGRMQALIGDLLKLARLEADVITTRQEILDIPAMLHRVIEDAGALSKRHRIESAIETDLLLVGRESEAQSIFSNLVENAVQYTPVDGRIDVKWWSDERGAHFSVTDSGIGIAQADIPRVTERFYRVDVGRSRASGGTGLGLSIVKHALELHEGRLEIESGLGTGSTFACHFPPHRVQRRRQPAANG